MAAPAPPTRPRQAQRLRTPPHHCVPELHVARQHSSTRRAPQTAPEGGVSGASKGAATRGARIDAPASRAPACPSNRDRKGHCELRFRTMRKWGGGGWWAASQIWNNAAQVWSHLGLRMLRLRSRMYRRGAGDPSSCSRNLEQQALSRGGQWQESILHGATGDRAPPLGLLPLRAHFPRRRIIRATAQRRGPARRPRRN